MRVNNDVTLGLTTCHWLRQTWPQCDIIIDPHYHRTPYFRQVKQTSTNRGFLPFVYRYTDSGPLNNSACAKQTDKCLSLIS